jgi:acyl carrier protein
MTSNFEKLRHLCAECLQIPVGQVTYSLSQDQIPSWDSVATAILIPELEEVFGVSFDIDEILELTSIDEIIKVLKDKGVPF